MKKILMCGILAAASMTLPAQEKGYLTGSFETTDHVYVADEGNKFTPDDDRFGSNNYIKLDYYNGINIYHWFAYFVRACVRIF